MSLLDIAAIGFAILGVWFYLGGDKRSVLRGLALFAMSLVALTISRPKEVLDGVILVWNIPLIATVTMGEAATLILSMVLSLAVITKLIDFMMGDE